jgi:hypothetical protein
MTDPWRMDEFGPNLNTPGMYQYRCTSALLVSAGVVGVSVGDLGQAEGVSIPTL